MKQWSTNPDGTYSLNLSNKHGTCNITLHDDHVNLNYNINGQKFGEAWPIKNTKQPNISQRLALIPILEYISNKIVQAKMKLKQVIQTNTEFFKTEIQFFETIKYNIEEFLEIPND